MDFLSKLNQQNARQHRALYGEAYPIDAFIDKLVADLRRSCFLSDPTCLYVAAKQVQKELKKKRLPIRYVQARNLLTSKQ